MEDQQPVYRTVPVEVPLGEVLPLQHRLAGLLDECGSSYVTLVGAVRTPMPL